MDTMARLSPESQLEVIQSYDPETGMSQVGDNYKNYQIWIIDVKTDDPLLHRSTSEIAEIVRKRPIIEGYFIGPDIKYMLMG